jgi:hypothetical protein
MSCGRLRLILEDLAERSSGIFSEGIGLIATDRTSHPIIRKIK